MKLITIAGMLWTIGGRYVYVVGEWILKYAIWDDDGKWIDTANWTDNE
jgi:hypothetical protein